MSADPVARRSLVRLTDVGKVFRSAYVEVRALEGVNLELEPGEFVAVEGPSGCGKSTLLGLIGLLDLPTHGEVWVNGEAASTLGAVERARIRREQLGFVFQSFQLIGHLTLAENVELPLLYREMAPKERRRRAESALERVGLAHRSRHLPEQLSGGQQQRVAVARAIVGDPALVLADEPTGNLDSSNGEAVMQLLVELNEAGTTVCMVTHDPRYAEVAKRTVRLFDGRVVAERVRRS